MQSAALQRPIAWTAGCGMLPRMSSSFDGSAGVEAGSASARGSAPIDLRSDTVTQPTAGMRAAIAAAQVGDDLYGEDPTVQALQEQVAALLGKEAALFVPSGTMANQLALRLHTRPGDDVLVSEGAHIKWYEAGAAAALAGLQLVTVGQAEPSGLLEAADLRAVYQPRRSDHASPPMTLLCLENTHNRGGGRVWPQAQLAAVCAEARALGMKLHLDGARLWNAAVFLQVPPRDLAAPFDTVSVCLSKGLGAPAGSLICGGRAEIDLARRYRRMYGGSMRQAGILAAAGVYALTRHYDRLQVDHDNALLIANHLRGVRSVRVVQPVETNILLFDLLEGAPDAAAVVRSLAQRGVLASAFGPRRVRLVTHLDVAREACLVAAQKVAAILEPHAGR